MKVSDIMDRMEDLKRLHSLIENEVEPTETERAMLLSILSSEIVRLSDLEVVGK